MWPVCCKLPNTHLSFLDSHRLASGRRLLVDAGQEVLRDPQGVLQKRVVRVAGGSVFEQVLDSSCSKWRNVNFQICRQKNRYIQVNQVFSF